MSESELTSVAEEGEESAMPAFRQLKCAAQLMWKKPDVLLQYKVNHLELPLELCNTYMHRRKPEAYEAACGTSFDLAIYPTENHLLVPHRLTQKPAKADVVEMSRVVKAVRIRRIVILDELIRLKTQLKSLRALQAQCQEKMDFHVKRMQLLENELSLFIPYEEFVHANKFSTFLSHSVGWMTVTSSLTKEFKTLLTLTDPNAMRPGLLLSLDEVTSAWELLRIWQIVHSVAVRAHVGYTSYRTASQASKAVSKNMPATYARKQRKMSDSNSVNSIESQKRRKSALEPLVPGAAASAWSSVVALLGIETTHPEDIDILTAGLALQTFITTPALSFVISRLSYNTLNIVLKDEVVAEQDVNRQLSSALISVADDIGAELEKLLLDGMRRVSGWSMALETIRKERVRKEGGQIVLRDNAAVEIDSQGRIRVIPNADEIVDTNIFHGSMQRLKIHVALPEVARRIAVCTEKRFQLNGELAAVIQLGYSTAAPFAQRAIRGSLARKLATRMLRNLALFSLHSAAATLQCWFRKRVGKAKYEEAAEIARHYFATLIAKAARGFLARKLGRRLVAEKDYWLRYYAAVGMQKLIRGYLGRRRHEETKAAAIHEKEKHQKHWGVVVIQRIARGYIARKSIVRSRHIRNRLDPELLRMVERYLTRKGDLWSFLEGVDDMLTRLKRTIDENQKREDDFAETFVNKVLLLRQQQFDSAWENFNRNVSSATTTVVASSSTIGAADGHLTALPTSADAGLRNLLTGERGKRQGAFSLAASATLPPHSAEATIPAVPPGPVVRRAVSATVQHAVDAELERQKKSEALSVKSMEHISRVYGAEAQIPSSAAGQGTHQTARAPMSPTRRDSARFSATTASPTRRQRSSSTLSASPFKQQKQQQGSNLSSVYQSEWAFDQTSEGAKHMKVDAGVSLLVDIPDGIDDKISRLFQAAAIRCFVPDFFSAETTPADAYTFYLSLPPGLIKVRYEQNAYSWSQPFVSTLQSRGLIKIKDLLPLSKLQLFLKNIDVPTVLLRQIEDIVRKLSVLGPTPAGFMNPDVKADGARVSAGEVTLRQAVNIANHIRQQQNSAPSVQAEETAVDTEEQRQHDDAYDRAQRLLEQMILRGDWNKVTSPVDMLLQHAAFLICPYESYSTPASTTSKVLSQENFCSFVREVVSLPSETHRKEAIRQRYRAAVILSTPYELKLKERDIATVGDLVEVELSSLQLPDVYQAQVEALLNMAVSISCEVRVTAGNSAATAKELREDITARTAHSFIQSFRTSFEESDVGSLVRVPLTFDPKFQRGPLDPYGRPPRLSGLKALKKMDGYISSNEADTPLGLWQKEEQKKHENNKDTSYYQFHPHNNIQHQDSASFLKEATIEPPKGQARPRNAVLSRLAKKTQQTVEKLQEKEMQFSTDMMFERSYKCSYPGCPQAFSRAYTLKVHEKSHELFPTYHNYRSNPMLVMDENAEGMLREMRIRMTSRESLPLMRTAELQALMSRSKSFK